LEDLDLRYTFTGNIYNLYHVPVIRNQLTRGISAFMPDVAEEMQVAFADGIDSQLNDKGKTFSRFVNVRMDSDSCI
jgi:hypothetical protein